MNFLNSKGNNKNKLKAFMVLYLYGLSFIHLKIDFFLTWKNKFIKLNIIQTHNTGSNTYNIKTETWEKYLQNNSWNI